MPARGEASDSEQSAMSRKPNDEENAIPLGEEKEQQRDGNNIVDWDGENDPANPRNWSTRYKAFITFQLGMLALAASLGSSIIAPAENSISEYTGVSKEVTVLAISLYILGFALGPSCWAPVSELYGRRWSMIPAMFMLGFFSIGTAVAKNIKTILITRFLGGLFGSAPVSNVGAALGDLYAPKSRGIAITFYAIAVVGGPTLGPVIGAALVVNPHLGWRWTEYIEAIWAFASVALCFAALPEMYAPVLLAAKAKRLRQETGNEALYHPHERIKVSVKTIVTKHFSRPLKMLLTEPMVTCIALYASFVFALLYGTLEVFPIVFEENRHWSPLVASLPFLGLFIGVCAAVFVNLGNQSRYARISDAAHGKPVPEGRLAPMAIGGFLFAIGLFWFGWTASPNISWDSSVIATAFIGAGFNIIFQQCINFLIDTYGLYAASAVSANTFLRSVLAAALPLVTRPMFHNLGVAPAMSIFGGIATLAIPVPFIFMKYGMALRKKSSFAPVE